MDGPWAVVGTPLTARKLLTGLAEVGVKTVQRLELGRGTLLVLVLQPPKACTYVPLLRKWGAVGMYVAVDATDPASTELLRAIEECRPEVEVVVASDTGVEAGFPVVSFDTARRRLAEALGLRLPPALEYLPLPTGGGHGPLSAEEERVLGLVDGRRRSSEIALELGVPHRVVLIRLKTLQLKGYVRLRVVS